MNIKTLYLIKLIKCFCVTGGVWKDLSVSKSEYYFFD